MVESKTTSVRRRKIDGLCELIQNLVYFATHYQKSDLWIVKSSDLKKVLKITNSWREGLKTFEKEPQNNNTELIDTDGTADTLKGIKKVKR